MNCDRKLKFLILFSVQLSFLFVIFLLLILDSSHEKSIYHLTGGNYHLIDSLWNSSCEWKVNSFVGIISEKIKYLQIILWFSNSYNHDCAALVCFHKITLKNIEMSSYSCCTQDLMVAAVLSEFTLMQLKLQVNLVGVDFLFSVTMKGCQLQDWLISISTTASLIQTLNLLCILDSLHMNWSVWILYFFKVTVNLFRIFPFLELAVLF